MKIAVIGAGPAGITAAYQLSKAIGTGRVTALDVYEAADVVGGLSKSLNLWNQKVDLGPHRFFSNDLAVNELWLEVVGKEYDIVNRLTRIYYNNKFYYYPIRAFNALSNLGIWEAAACVFSYLIEKISPASKLDNFETWVSNRFGKRLYRIFFKIYSEKLWGIPCTELDSDFASQRIKKLSLYEAVKNAVFKSKNNKHKTLVEQFAYPLHGTGSVYTKMAEVIEKNGGRVYLKKAVQKILTLNKKAYALEFPDGSIIEYDHIISTMPLSLMVTQLPQVPEEIKSAAMQLRFRNTILVYLKLESKELFPDQWLYIHSKDILFGRITNFRNWLPSLYGNEESSILCLEYWCNFEDEFWEKTDEEITEIALKEITNTRLTGDSEISDAFVYRIPRCYPVYFSKYAEILKPVEEYLDTVSGLSVIGRYGAYKYNNQDHSILMGIKAAENILFNSGHNLWEINTDYETYQEQSTITKTGLSRS